MCPSVLCPARPIAWHQAPLDWTLFHPVQGPPHYTTTSSLTAKPWPALSLSTIPPQTFPPQDSQALGSLFSSSFYLPFLVPSSAFPYWSPHQIGSHLNSLLWPWPHVLLESTCPHCGVNNYLHVHTSQTSTFSLHRTWVPCSQLFVRHFYQTYLLAKWSSTCLKPTQLFTQWLFADCSLGAVCCLRYW